jgi:hypothetical protein
VGELEDAIVIDLRSTAVQETVSAEFGSSREISRWLAAIRGVERSGGRRPGHDETRHRALSDLAASLYEQPGSAAYTVVEGLALAGETDLCLDVISGFIATRIDALCGERLPASIRAHCRPFVPGTSWVWSTVAADVSRLPLRFRGCRIADDSACRVLVGPISGEGGPRCSLAISLDTTPAGAGSPPMTVVAFEIPVDTSSASVHRVDDGRAVEALERAVTVMIAGVALGLARRLFDATVAYTRDRRRTASRDFEHEVVHTHIAEMVADVLSGRLVILDGADEDGHDPSHLSTAAVARHVAQVTADVARRATDIVGARALLESGPIDPLARSLNEFGLLLSGWSGRE